MDENLLFIGAGAEAGQNGPGPQHWLLVCFRPQIFHVLNPATSRGSLRGSGQI